MQFCSTVEGGSGDLMATNKLNGWGGVGEGQPREREEEDPLLLPGGGRPRCGQWVSGRGGGEGGGGGGSREETPLRLDTLSSEWRSSRTGQDRQDRSRSQLQKWRGGGVLGKRDEEDSKVIVRRKSVKTITAWTEILRKERKKILWAIELQQSRHRAGRKPRPAAAACRKSKMPPDIMSSHLTSPSKSKRQSLVCCDYCGFGMAKILPPELSRQPTPVGKLNIAAMLLGHLTQVTMVWVKKWWHFWQSFPANMIKAVFMGIAKGAYRVALAAAPLEKEDVIRRNEEMQNLKVAHHLEHLILNSLESLVEDGHLGESPKQHLNGSNSVDMEKIQMEEEHMSEQCLVYSSTSFEFGSNWEDSSEEDMELDNMETPEKFYQKWLKDHCNPQMFTKILDISGYFGENLKDSHTLHRKMRDAEVSFCQCLGSPSVSRERKEGLESTGDFATHEEQSTDHSTDSPVLGKHLESYRKDEDKGSLNLGTHTISHGFKSPLVLSLFYSPSEDEDDNEDESEDWWSEDEVEENRQSQASLDGGDSGKEVKSLEVDNDPIHQDVLERLREPFFLNNDPFYLLCSSKPIQVHKAPTVAPTEPKNHKEIAVSFYLTEMDSKPEEFCNPPKPPWPPKDPRANCRPPAHKCYQSSSRKSDPITTETPSVSQEQNQVIKKVRFSPVVTIHPLIVWDYASRAARRGPWEEMARDRSRFSRRIAELGAILEPCLEKDHRAKAWKKMHGVLNSLDDNTTTPLSPSSGADKRRVQTEL